MSSTDPQLWMLAAAGIVLVVFVVGFRWQERSATSRWVLALLAAGGCAVAPALTTRLDIVGVGPRPDLGHSLLVATAVVAAVALLALLTGRSRASQHRPGSVPEAAAGLVRLSIDADSRVAADARESAADRDGPRERRRPETARETPSRAPTSAAETDAMLPSIDASADGPAGARRAAHGIGTGPGSPATAPDALDLTETQRLFRDLRERDREIDLPTDAPWLTTPSRSPLDAMATPGDGELIAAIRAPATPSDARPASDDAVEATLLGEELAAPVDRPANVDLATLAGGAPAPDADGSTARTPGSTEDEPAAASVSDEGAPAAAPAPREGVDDAGSETREVEFDMAHHRDRAARLADSERDGRLAALALADERAATIERLRAKLERIGARTVDLETRLKDREEELERAQRTARDAARLAREAATRRRELERALDEMRVANARQQRATDRAVAIARNAIAALPASLAPSGAPPSTPANALTEPTTTFPDASRIDDALSEPSIDDANENASHIDPYDR